MIITRTRRLRYSQTLRDMVQENHVHMDDLIYPIFVEEGIKNFTPIESLPGIVRIPEVSLAKEIKKISCLGIRAVMLFGISHHKDKTGSDSLMPDGLLARMLKTAKDAAPEMCIISDNCFCEYTSHGHCGVIEHGEVMNDATLENIGKQAVVCAQAGADMVAPSGMMDGQVLFIRNALDAEGFYNTPIMAYASKMASSFYGPFREAAGCELKGDRKQYQMNPANGREALREAILDEEEGADILMVKPGLPYLDVLAKVKEYSSLPVVVYQVSGEYAMIKFAAQAGAIDEDRVIMETLTSFKRAGADLILSYFAPQVSRILNE